MLIFFINLIIRVSDFSNGVNGCGRRVETHTHCGNSQCREKAILSAPPRFFERVAAPGVRM
jgi:hypothetical protein